MNTGMIGIRRLLHLQGPLLGLIGLMFGIYLFQAVFGPGWYDGLMAVPGEVVESWHRLLAGEATAMDWREFGTLITCAMLHGSLEHVLFNMLYFWIFGALLVELSGWRWMLLLFLATAFGGSITHVMLNRMEFIPMLGASGAVMGFEGAYLGLAVRWSLPDPHVWPMSKPIPPVRLGLLAVIGVFFDYQAIITGVDEGIAYGAHVGGFTTGLFLAAVIMPRPKMAGLR